MNSTQNDKIVYADEWNVSSQYFYKNEYYNWMADNITGHKKVLEIGCGTGYSTLALLEKGFDVIAIEKNEEYIRKAEQLVSKSGYFDSKVVFLQGDIAEETFRNNILEQYDFDIVICWNIGSYWNREMMTYYLPHMIEYGLDIQQIRSNPESSYAELIVWYACKVAKEKNVSVNIVDRCGEQLNEHNDPYYKCLKDEFSFVKIEYKNKEGKSLSKGGRVLTTNGQASFESVMDIVFVSILLNN